MHCAGPDHVADREREQRSGVRVAMVSPAVRSNAYHPENVAAVLVEAALAPRHDRIVGGESQLRHRGDDGGGAVTFHVASGEAFVSRLFVELGCPDRGRRPDGSSPGLVVHRYVTARSGIGGHSRRTMPLQAGLQLARETG